MSDTEQDLIAHDDNDSEGDVMVREGDDEYRNDVHQNDYLPFDCPCGRARVMWIARRRLACDKCDRTWTYCGPGPTCTS